MASPCCFTPMTSLSEEGSCASSTAAPPASGQGGPSTAPVAPAQAAPDQAHTGVVLANVPSEYDSETFKELHGLCDLQHAFSDFYENNGGVRQPVPPDTIPGPRKIQGVLLMYNNAVCKEGDLCSCILTTVPPQAPNSFPHKTRPCILHKHLGTRGSKCAYHHDVIHDNDNATPSSSALLATGEAPPVGRAER